MNFLKSIFGSKPSVPVLPELSLDESQRKAIAANIQAEPEAAKLSDLTADQIDALIRRTTPNAEGIFGGASRAIEDMILGKIPRDVQDFLKRSTAADALTGGFSGSGMHKNLTARDFGRTSLDLTLKGLSAAESWLQSSKALYAPAIATYTGMFVTPMQQATFDIDERNAQFQRSWMKSQIAAMPDPLARGIFDTIMSISESALSAAGGGGMGGGMGGMGMAMG